MFKNGPKPVDRDSPAQKFQQAYALHRQGRLTEADQLYRAILQVEPNHLDALTMSGAVALATSRPQRAADLIGQAVALKPDAAMAQSNLGYALKLLGRDNEALAAFDKAVVLRPGYANAFNHRGTVLRDLRRFDEALADFDRALALRPDFVEAYLNRATAFGLLRRFDDALADYDHALALNPSFPEAHCNRGNVLKELQRLPEAVASYEQALALKPDFVDAWINRGIALSALRQPDDALASFDRALAVVPDHPLASGYRGNALRDSMRFDESLASFGRALLLRPNDAETYNNRAITLVAMRRFEEALTDYDRAIALRPDNAVAYANRAAVLSDLGRAEDSVSSYERALELDPDREFLLGSLINAKLKIFDWTGLDILTTELTQKIGRGGKVTTPFAMFAIADSPALQKKAAEIYAAVEYPRDDRLGAIAGRTRRDKIRIGYFSADFRDHPVSLLTAGLYEQHDRSRFEITAFAFGPVSGDAIRQRLERAFDRFIDAAPMSDVAVAKLAREWEIDIAIDLGGFTDGCRTGIFALRAAPIQIGYLGYPGTMGAAYYDYLIADPVLVPDVAQQHFAEKIIYLPDSYQVNDDQRAIAAATASRVAAGLPEDAFVFCCFNNSYKINPAMFDAWMRILAQVPGSVLWLADRDASSRRRLAAETSARGIDPTRLIFAPRLPDPADHLARYQLADLFLDTLPYNGHTTASDALWAGLPVLTCAGESLACRVAASLLNAIGLSELIAPSIAAYEQLAIAIAQEPSRAKALKQQLAANRLQSPLFDTARFTRHLEAAYAIAYDRYHCQHPLASIIIAR